MTTVHRSIIGIVTAAVTPHAGVGLVTDTDPSDRLSQYGAALRKILAAGQLEHIHFAEGTGFLGTADGARFAAEHASERLSFADVDLTAVSPKYGKGRLELELIKSVVKGSGYGPEALFVKITGRHSISNLPSYIRSLQDRDEDLVGILHKNATFLDTRIVAFTRRYLVDYLVPREGLIDDRDGIFIEHVAATALHAMLGDGSGRWGMPSVRPKINGTSGSTGAAIRNTWLTGLVKDAAYAAYLRLLRS